MDHAVAPVTTAGFLAYPTYYYHPSAPLGSERVPPPENFRNSKCP